MRRPRAALALAGALVLGSTFAAPIRADDKQSFEQVERGRYLSVAGDCAACHTAPGGEPFAGGLPIATPFGTIVSSNITPDRETGIGNWSDDTFVAALHQGLGANRENLYPAMPYPAYTKMTRADALAIRTYLWTIAPVKHAVVSDQLPFPLDIRLNMKVWNALNFTEGRYKPVADKSAEWNRGAYLVQGLGHCGTCHTPKTVLGAEKDGEALKGSEIENWLAPDLTNAPRTGLSAWSADDIVSYLKTGANQHGIASGPMSDVIRLSTSQMTDGDLKAMAVYLKDLSPPASPTVAPLPETDARMSAGAAIYKDSCAACHRDDGAGIGHLFPSLAGDNAVQDPNAATPIHIVLNGGQGVATPGAPTAPAMPGFAWAMSDEQVAAVVTYIRNSWGNAAPAVTPADVKSRRGGSAGN